MDVIFDLPQEDFTAILRGRGPRRGNLERLLRYWRPIMKKPGGFRRCRVILANHPNLYPLENICAWLHHETTGQWPNEGCHHPGMKNCKGKLKKLGWSDNQFSNILKRKLRGTGKKELPINSNDVFFFDSDFTKSSFDEIGYVVTEGDVNHAVLVLHDFIEMEEKFINFLGQEQNWEQIGENSNGEEIAMTRINIKSSDEECCNGF